MKNNKDEEDKKMEEYLWDNENEIIMVKFKREY